MASLVEIQALVQRIRDDLPLLINRSQIAPKQIVTVEGLSDISERLGLVQAGEFRAGNGNEPGFGFSGVRIGYPAFAYAGDTYDFVGVNDDTLEVGISSDDGKLYFGAGTGVLNSAGIEIRASGLYINSNGYKFVDADYPDNILGGLYSIVRHDFNDLFVELRAQPEDGSLTVATASVDAVAGATAVARLTADSGGYGGNASMLHLLQSASARTLYTTDVTLVDFSDVTTTEMSDVVIVDGSTEKRLEIGADHYFPTRDSINPNVYINEASEDMDFVVRGTTDDDLLHTDAANNRVGISTPTPGYTLDVDGDINFTGTLYQDGAEFSGGSATDGWATITDTWTRTGNFTFTVSGDVTFEYHTGAKLSWFDNGVQKFGIILSASFGGSDTTITMFTNTDYVMAAGATITDTEMSYSENPIGFPSYLNYTPATVNVTLGNGSISGKFMVHDEEVFGSWTLTRGSTTSFTGNLYVSPPTTGTLQENQYFVIGNVSLVDAATALYTGIQLADHTVRCMTTGGSYAVYAYVTNTVPFSWGTGDFIEASFRYRYT